MHCFYKTWVILYILRWGQPSIWIYFQNNPLFPKSSSVTEFVPTYSNQPAPSFLYQHTLSALRILLFCYILFPRPQSSWVVSSSTCASAQSRQRGSLRILKHSSIIDPQTSPPCRDPTEACSEVYVQSGMDQRSFSCTSAEACSGSTPCVRGGRRGSQTSARSWVCRFWRRGLRWCRLACTRLSDNRGWSWCGRGRSWPWEGGHFVVSLFWPRQRGILLQVKSACVFTWRVPSLKSIMRARSDLSHCSR